jgi:acyl-CoA dehydrogenase
VMGGIGYTDIYPIERIVRDIRLTQIWTGTNEIMNLLVQHEYYNETLSGERAGRDIEADAAHPTAGEKVYTDDDQTF